MYYKVVKDGRVIDVLDHLIYVKYQRKHNIMLLCDKSEAQAIASSDGSHFWHVRGLYKVPVDGYCTVELEEIDEFEASRLKALNGKTPEEIIDAFVLSLLEGGVL